MADAGNGKAFVPLADMTGSSGFVPLKSSETTPVFLPLSWREPIPTSVAEAQPEGQERRTEISDSSDANSHGGSIDRVPNLQELNDVILELSEELSRVRDAQDERIAASETVYAKEYADKIIEALHLAETRIRDEISTAVGTVLRPFVTEHLEQKIVSVFADELSQCICESELTRLTIHGPARLLDALKRIANGRFAEISYMVSGGMDLVANVNGKYLSTRIHYWNSLLHGEET